MASRGGQALWVVRQPQGEAEAPSPGQMRALGHSPVLPCGERCAPTLLCGQEGRDLIYGGVSMKAYEVSVAGT